MLTLQAAVIAEGNKDFLIVGLHTQAFHVSAVVIPHDALLEGNRHLVIFVRHGLVERSRPALELEGVSAKVPDLWVACMSRKRLSLAVSG